jgi:hypothetical protein
MARTEGRHRITRRTKIATGLIGLAIAATGVVVATTAGGPSNAGADPVDKSFFVDITTVAPNVKAPRANGRAASGTFTVNCGRNENGHFNPDNFIAQPGVHNGAQHLHDYVGNLTTNADSNNKSLLAGGTTCKNGDKSAYFWPVVRIDKGEAEASNAPESPAQTNLPADRAQAAQAAATPQVDCPDVASQLGDVSDQATPAVETELGNLDQQVADADQQMPAAEAQGGQAAAQSKVLQPLRDKRKASIDKISQATGQPMDQQQDLATCAVKDQASDGLDNGGQNSAGGGQAAGSAGSNAPATTSPASSSAAPTSSASSTASATDSSTAASSSASATSSAATTTSAAELPGVDANNQLAGNDGAIQEPQTVLLTFRGSPVGNVRAMPKFLRVLSGDAKEGANGPKNARAAWTCTGFEDRLIDKYPICPVGSKVERIHDFPSCWDGKNIDSANHRTHIVFPDANGRCARGFVAVPQLRVTLIYDIPHDVQVAGQYKVDSFPEEHHNPLSDHDDFANVMSQRIMSRVVNCINHDRTCRE